ncbi:MAG: response regulator [Deltaproteobacteria bacterium]|nr:response regulator [Deltaproteobacteria bacterium]
MTPSSPKSTTVLVIEDDDAIRQGLVDALEFEGYPVVQAATAPRGLQAAIEGAVGLVLLDLMLPGGDGFEVLKEVRRTRSGLPVIILTARGREADRVQGLRLGADDYVVKPFSVKELLARVEAVLRRVRVAGPEPAAVTEVAIPGGTIDLRAARSRFDDGARVEAVGARVAAGRLPRRPRRACGRSRRAAAAGMAAQPLALPDPHHRHARRAAAREAARHPRRAAGDPHRAR